MNYRDQLRKIEKDEARLAKKKIKLEAKLERTREQDAKVEGLFKSSGYATPKALVKALMIRFGLRGAQGGARRKRTKITADLRNEIKKAVKGGTSMNAASKQFGLSYAVVGKIMKGHYDKLK